MLLMDRPATSVPTRLTKRQKQAVALEREGLSHQRIAELMGLGSRQCASQLIARAKAAEQAILNFRFQ